MNYSLEHNKYAKVNFTPENPCWFNFYGSYLIKTTYDENTRKYTEEYTKEKALEVLEHMSLNDEERESYEARLKWLRDEEMALKKAKEDGMAEGEQKGIQIGEEKAQAEKLEIAKELLKKGIDREIVFSIIHLTQEQINQLK